MGGGKMPAARGKTFLGSSANPIGAALTESGLSESDQEKANIVLDPGGLLTEKTFFAKPEEIPVPEIPELEGMSAADITLRAQAAREEERRKMAGKRGRQSTIVTGPLGIQSAASTTRGPI